jgi:hypothetical protein
MMASASTARSRIVGSQLFCAAISSPGARTSIIKFEWQIIELGLQEKAKDVMANYSSVR